MFSPPSETRPPSFPILPERSTSRPTERPASRQARFNPGEVVTIYSEDYARRGLSRKRETGAITHQTVCVTAAGAALAPNEAGQTRIARKARQGIPPDSGGVFFPRIDES